MRMEEHTSYNIPSDSDLERANFRSLPEMVEWLEGMGFVQDHDFEIRSNRHVDPHSDNDTILLDGTHINDPKRWQLNGAGRIKLKCIRDNLRAAFEVGSGWTFYEQ